MLCRRHTIQTVCLYRSTMLGRPHTIQTVCLYRYTIYIGPTQYKLYVCMKLQCYVGPTQYKLCLYRSRMFFIHISSIVLVPWFSCLGGYLSVPDDYPLVLGCDEHVSSSCLRSLVVRALEQ